MCCISKSIKFHKWKKRVCIANIEELPNKSLYWNSNQMSKYANLLRSVWNITKLKLKQMRKATFGLYQAKYSIAYYFLYLSKYQATQSSTSVPSVSILWSKEKGGGIQIEATLKVFWIFLRESQPWEFMDLSEDLVLSNLLYLQLI